LEFKTDSILFFVMTQRILTAFAVTAAMLLAVPAVRHWREQPPDPPAPPAPLRAAFVASGAAHIGAGFDHPFGLALAPDGRRIAYPAATAGVVALWLHDLRTGDAQPLPGTDAAAAPFWSADGTRVGFFAGGELRVADLAAGSVAALAEAPSGRGAAWNAAGDIVFAPSAGSGLMRRAVNGSVAALTTVNTAAGETAHAWPAFLRDGRHVVFLVSANDRAREGIWIASLDDPAARRRLMAGDSQPLVVPTQDPGPKTLDPVILSASDQTLTARSLNAATLELAERGDAVGRPVGRGPLGQVFATATADVLIFGPPGTRLRELRWLSRSGAAVAPAGEPVDAWDVRVAPDGRRVAFTAIDPQLRTLDVFIREGSQPAARRLSLITDADESAVWSPDGLRIAWVARRREVMIRGAGAVLPEQAIAEFRSPVQVWDWSRDGRSLLIGVAGAASGDDLWVQPPVAGAEAQPYTTAAFNQVYGAFSPDGRWVAYASDESGAFDVYVDSFPKPGARLRVTTAGGTEPRWGRDGRELYFRRGAEIHAVSLRPAGAALEVMAIARLFDAGVPIRAYDATRDGARFLVNVPAAGGTDQSATIVVGWNR
jgi:eukaryotic-like serine/threonine-protein kinase